MTPPRPELVGHFGMAASTHYLATATAMSVLERGGNAFDAAAAGGFVLQVVEPHMNGPAGEVPMLLWDAAAGGAQVLCGQGVAPAAASVAKFRELGLELVPGTGPLAATVPGSFGAWTLLVERWGTWSLADVLDYAIGFCESGFPALPRIVDTIAEVSELFVKHWPTSAAVWLSGGAPPRAGGRLRNPALGRTYRRIVEEATRAGGSREAQLRAARDIWYRGWVAEEIGRFCADTHWLDTSGREHGGLLTADDMAGWEPTVEAPAVFDYAGRYQVLKTGVWGQGPAFGQQLALLDGLDLDAYGTPDYLHAVIESTKLAFADREAWYGDSAHPDTLALLLAPEYTAARRSLIGPEASLELRPGHLGDRAPRLPRFALSPVGEALAGVGALGMAGLGMTLPGAGEPTLASSAGVGEPVTGPDGRVNGDTCHLDVVDSAGNMVSATPSGGWLQSSPVLPELGFPLGTRGQMFAIEDGLPNSLRPGARPRTTLSPSMALRDGEPWMAFGTPGGDQQDQWSLHFFLAMVHGGLGPQAAIEAPAMHSGHFPSSFYPRASNPGQLTVESRFPPSVLTELRRRGHRIVESDPWSLGRLSAVLRESDHLVAAANPRGSQGYAAGR
ncbi:gamma-glutamyltransferase family protein [Pseudonocardia acaciae]|uniref:gamma-glutamyltransferase family protein n=1 Tax=Pseudonocardia acaciae TaxID=551276 RepID=UPI0014702896|nr:gamma-glutamyltransferase [Pseudonocardia acaciae]